MKYTIDGNNHDTDVAEMIMRVELKVTAAPWINATETLYQAPGDVYFVVSHDKYGTTARRMDKKTATLWQIDRILHSG